MRTPNPTVGVLVVTLVVMCLALIATAGGAACSGCSHPTVVHPIVVTNDQCAVFELEDELRVVRQEALILVKRARISRA